ncbi:MAG: hypothetical protein AB8B47_14130 [Roseobacter sp.]
MKYLTVLTLALAASPAFAHHTGDAAMAHASSASFTTMFCVLAACAVAYLGLTRIKS